MSRSSGLNILTSDEPTLGGDEPLRVEVSCYSSQAWCLLMGDKWPSALSHEEGEERRRRSGSSSHRRLFSDGVTEASSPAPSCSVRGRPHRWGPDRSCACPLWGLLVLGLNRPSYSSAGSGLLLLLAA